MRARTAKSFTGIKELVRSVFGFGRILPVHHFLIMWGCGWMITVILGMLPQLGGPSLTRRPFHMWALDIAIALIIWPLQLFFVFLMVTLMWGKRGQRGNDS
jgi:hypothetical protein